MEQNRFGLSDESCTNNVMLLFGGLKAQGLMEKVSADHRNKFLCLPKYS